MELLEAVNTVLPYIGEHPITRIEGAKHPTVDLALAAIKRQQDMLLAEKWWFNRLDVRLQPNTEGRIEVPKDTLEIYGKDCRVTLDGEYLFNLETGSRTFDKAINVEICRNIPFNKLPVNAAYHIMYLACCEVYLADFGRENTIPELQALANDQLVRLREVHLRQMRFNKNTKSRNSMWRVKFR